MSVMENPPQDQAFPEPAPSPAARPAAPPVSVRFDPLNLSRRPFLNSRPVVRISLLLWLLGLLLLLGNVSLFWGYLSSSEDKRTEIASGDEAIQKRQTEVRELETRLDSIDLEDLNDKIRFLNGKIEERTFSWNLLLDRLAEVLPNDVRLNRLDPATGDRQRAVRGSRGVRRGQVPEGQVLLEIVGETRNNDALLRFVDNLYAHPAFAYPNTVREERAQDSNLVIFELNVRYVPGSQPQNVVIEEVAAPAGTPGPAAPAPGGRP